MRVRKNDQVLVLSGNYKGKKGKVLKVFPEESRVIVEGVNFIKRHSRPTQQNPQGGIIEKEAPIHAMRSTRISLTKRRQQSSRTASNRHRPGNKH